MVEKWTAPPVASMRTCWVMGMLEEVATAWDTVLRAWSISSFWQENCMAVSLLVVVAAVVGRQFSVWWTVPSWSGASRMRRARGVRSRVAGVGRRR